MTNKKRTATASVSYRTFIAQRDKALEQIYLGANEEINDLLRKALMRAINIVAFRYSQIPPDGMLTLQGKQVLALMDSNIAQEFILSARHIAGVIEQMNRNVYALALVGEAEAIGRALKTFAKYEVREKDLEKVSTQDMQGESIEGHVSLAFSRIRRKIMDSIELSRVKEESPQEAIERVKSVMPKARSVKRPKRKLIKLEEADKQVGEEYSYGIIEPEEWEAILSAYSKQYVPLFRGPNSVFDVTTDGLLEEWYGWEIEQYVGNEFVASVRSGQDKAAKQNGVTDMVWIAVVDDKTDECCLWRDGLTSAEIEKELKSGKHKSDECDSIIPPAHFNCRCSMSPLLDVQMDGEEFERPATNQMEFSQWLNS